ncbi:MAG: thioesterase family protein [Betaproteobacteria bacterium]
MTAPLCTYRSAVIPEWVDYNGHLRDAYYLLLFSLATDALMDQLGLDEAGRAATGHSLYTLECHLNFVREVKLGQQVEVRTQILGHDQKRLHLSHSLHLWGEASLLAASEQMLLNVATAMGRAAPFDALVQGRVEALALAHQGLPVPRFAGRAISLTRS